MRSTLASRKNGIVDSLLEIRGILQVFPEEDQASTRTTECLMCGGGNNITVFKGAVEFLSSNETTGVGNVSHEPGAFARGDFL